VVVSSPILQTGARLQAAVSLAEAAAQALGLRFAMPAYRLAVQLVEELQWLGLGRDDQIRHMTSFAPRIANDAAASACANRRFDIACELLEQGRAVLWTQFLHINAEFNALRVVDGSLAKALERCRGAIRSARSA
jgi:hypothetical protein